VRYLLLCVPVLYCIADYAETWALAETLEAFPSIPYRLARRASILAAAKSQLVTAALGIALALAIAAWGRAHRQGPGGTRS
jgi:ABC-type sulfate transport system permease component